MRQVINIIAACCGECESLASSFSEAKESHAVHNDAFPRLETIQTLLHIIANHSKLAKDAASALTDLGAAIKDTATTTEISEIIAGTLSKDSNVRNAALQALQVLNLILPLMKLIQTLAG